MFSRYTFKSRLQLRDPFYALFYWPSPLQVHQFIYLVYQQLSTSCFKNICNGDNLGGQWDTYQNVTDCNRPLVHVVEYAPGKSLIIYGTFCACIMYLQYSLYLKYFKDKCFFVVFVFNTLCWIRKNLFYSGSISIWLKMYLYILTYSTSSV